MTATREPSRSAEVTRRVMLRRGVGVAAGAVWVAPVVTALSMTPASADTPSGSVTTPPVTTPPVTTPPVTTPPVTPTPSFSIDPTSVTQSPSDSGTPSDPGTSSGSGAPSSSGSSTATPLLGAHTTSGGGGVLAFTGTEVPIATAVAVGLGAVTAGAAMHARRRKPEHAD